MHSSILDWEYRALMMSVICCAVFSFVGNVPGKEDVKYDRDIRPILSDRCFRCHGPSGDSREGGLRLDQPDGDEGAHTMGAVVPGDVQASELWSRITSDDPDIQMPPPAAHKKQLTDVERDLIQHWIEQGAKYERFWSFVAPHRAPLGASDAGDWDIEMIDRYVMAHLEQRGLQPKMRADKRTLIRRVTLDLTGLPPTLAEIEAFLQDDTPDAYQRLVDRLLGESAYGEHMARYWADLVRLADTNGMHKDFYRNFSAYRSWLIRAFNDNVPYDQFITYQIAGDLFPEPSEDQLVASGFNRLHLIIDRGTALPEESLHKNVLDRVEAFGTAFLGLTVQCAQCHEHKYDPISQREFYQLYAFFNNFDGEPETDNSPRRGIQEPAIELVTGAVEDGSNKMLAMVMKERTEPRPTHVLIRGSYEHPGELVERRTPAFLPPLPTKDGVYNRMDLAQWLLLPEHPLTARVAVNRLWQQFFGVGVVKTSEDFGRQGEYPSHPELLDALAVTFRESGWDVKQLVREIVLSSTYCQSSDASRAEFAQDSENRHLARGPRYRMDAEMLRDQLLLVSGKLNRTMYGESVKPPQPPGLWEAVSMAAPFTYVADQGDSIYRRSFYTYWRRAIPPPQMTILNAPSREFCTPRRERTNTPLQALLLMNEPEYLKLAGVCGLITYQEAGGDIPRGLARLYEKVTSQLPTDERLALMQQTLDEFRTHYQEQPALAESLAQTLQESLSTPIDMPPAEQAAWTMMAHSLLNLELAKVKR